MSVGLCRRSKPFRRPPLIRRSPFVKAECAAQMHASFDVPSAVVTDKDESSLDQPALRTAPTAALVHVPARQQVTLATRQVESITSVWDRVARNTRPLSEEEKKMRKDKANAEVIAQRNRDNLAAQLGTQDDSFLDLFAGSASTGRTNTDVTDNSATTSPSEAQEGFDFFATGASTSFSGGGDTFDFEAAREGLHFESSSSGVSRPPPFKGAYRFTKPRNWAQEDEEKLYKLLEVFGDDPMMLLGFWRPGEMTVQHLIKKLRKERKVNFRKYTTAVKKRSKIDTSEFEKVRGAPIDTSTHFRKGHEVETLAITSLRLESQADTQRRCGFNVFDNLFGVDEPAAGGDAADEEGELSDLMKDGKDERSPLGGDLKRSKDEPPAERYLDPEKFASIFNDL